MDGVRGTATVSPLFCQAQVFSSNVKTNCGERKSQKVGPRQETSGVRWMKGEDKKGERDGGQREKEGLCLSSPVSD